MTSTQSRPITLVTGGTGTTGRRVVERLTALGQPVRVGSRRGAPPFVWEDPATWEAALDGVDRVYLVHPEPFTPEAFGQLDAFSRAAVAHGARRLVLLSGRGSGDALAGEESVKNSGADWTMVRPGWFNQNFSETFYVDFAGAVRSGELALPFGDFTEAFVDADDIADVVVAALTDDRHVGRTYELSGPRLLSLSDVAAELSDATGREITYTPLTVDQYRVVLREQGLPEEYADIFAVSLNGDNAFLAHGVEEVLGRKPTDFTDYARATAATGVWNA